MNAAELSINQQLPAAVDSEQWLLGSLLMDGEMTADVRRIVGENHFTRDDHRRIFRYICMLDDEGIPVNIGTLSGRLEQVGELSRIGGLGYLSALATSVDGGENALVFAERVNAAYLLRRLAETSARINQRAIAPGDRNPWELLAEAEHAISAISDSSVSRRDFLDAREVMRRVAENMEKLLQRTEHTPITGLATGFEDIDFKTAGLQPGDMIVIAGRPSMGKTAFALNIAENVAINDGKPVAIFSLEMAAEQLGLRILSSIGRINFQNLRTGIMSDTDKQRMAYAINRIADAPIFINDMPNTTLPSIRSAVRRLHKQCGGLSLIVIDYIQLIHGSDRGRNRVEEVSDISRSIKALAREMQVPIIAISQLSRKVEERTDKRPLMSDLRESGAIEQDADLIMMMYRDEYYNKNSRDVGLAEIIIGKHRNGPTGTVQMSFRGEYSRFSDYRPKG